jgi:TfoX/Sxy family transcriptional regulator of competence genes
MIAEELATAVRGALTGAGEVREIKMFGGIGFMLNGNMVAAASARGLLLRVGADHQGKALARPGVRPMVMRGRALAGYVYVDPATLTDGAVQAWLELAMAFVLTLPPKAADARSKRSRGTRR